jgi:hypothetical protein
MTRSLETTTRRLVPTAARIVGLMAVAVMCMGVSVASAARWPQKHTTAAPVSPAEISSQLKSVTGYTSSQVDATPVCGMPQPGAYSCLAQVLTVRGSHRGVGPRATPHATRVETTTKHALLPAAAGQAAPNPLTPAYLQWSYDLGYLSANDGATDIVAIVDAWDDPKADPDMNAFRSNYGLPSLPKCTVPIASSTTSCFEVANQSQSTTTVNGTPPQSPPGGNANDDGWNVEESLDIDAVSAICPLCKILVVEANSDDGNGNPDLETAAGEAAKLGANQISMSFGSDTEASATAEASDWSSNGNSVFGSASPLAAVGDASYPGPPNYADSPYWGTTPANIDVVGYPAALENVTAVGGTSLATAPTGSRGFDESAWAIDTPCSFNPNSSSPCDGTESGCDISQPTPFYEQGNTAILSACDALSSSIGGSANSGGRAYSDVSADADPDTGLDIFDSRPYPYGCGTDWCQVGGTSLATPLTAAFEALTGTSGGTPAWAYVNDASKLNDIVSGSDGTCPSAQAAKLICNATTGWDGPTGNGSISGTVVTGAPGIGGTSVTPGGTTINPTANLTGGVYPNSMDTKTWWEWGTDTSYGNSTVDNQIDVGSGSTLTSAAALLTGLTPCAVYHYRLDASNSMGTTDGYDNTFTASVSAPANTVAPTISGTGQTGEPLTAQLGTWSPTACGNPTISYQWEESTNQAGPFTKIPGQTSSTYTPVSGDAQNYITVAVTETNAGGSGSATAQTAVGPVVIPTQTVTTPTQTTTTPTTTQTGTVVTSTTQSTSKGTSTTTVQFYRCAHTCTKINTHGATTYTVRAADNGEYIETKVTTTEPGSPPIVTTTWTGPITAPTAGAATIARAASAASILSIEGTRHAVLAHVRVTKRTSKAVTLAVTRQGKARTKVWAYVVSNGKVVSCTVQHVLTGQLKLNVALKSGQTLKLVAVRA